MTYMSRFSCIGPDCESTCCHGWTIFLTKPEFRALKKTLGGSKEGARRFRRSVKRFEGTGSIRPSSQLFAIINMNEETRDCGFLNEDRWCSLHSEFGEQSLGNVCALFPRLQSSFGARTELAGSIGCPETARMVLLTEDGCDITEVPEPMTFERRYLIGAIPKAETRPYFTHIDTVRGVFGHVLHATDHPLSVRWLVMAMFGQRTAPHFHRAGTDPTATESLVTHGEACLNPEDMTEAARFLEGVEISESVSARLLVLLLSTTATGTQFERFRTLARTIMNEYLKRSGQTTLEAEQAELRIQPEPALAAFRELRDWQSRFLGEHIEAVLTRFSHYYSFSQWHTKTPNLLVYVQRMLIEVTLFRFLVAGHPLLTGAMDALRGPDGALPETLDAGQLEALRETWDTAMIEVWHLLARNLEHAPQTLSELEAALAEQGLQSLGLVVHLIKT